ncbi:transcriptional regulator [Candidatus Epulonipiscioides gigas]|nr:transcriptional regulator [Epulopiscium sp. SCG-C07WGA-EpuloA2]
METFYVAKIFKSLCDENRVAIIELLKTGDKCACEIAESLNIAQSKLSYHMKILCESGLVESWYIGKWTYYKISQSGINTAISILQNMAIVDTQEKKISNC